ncbi:hypothetical protein ABIC75_004520 [Dyella japonica]|uniref:Transposase n=1 Tax=Dyella japonica TaxID=231455 RepID=A0ABV2K120_9GAMM
MKKRFTEEQIIGFLKQVATGTTASHAWWRQLANIADSAIGGCTSSSSVKISSPTTGECAAYTAKLASRHVSATNVKV